MSEAAKLWLLAGIGLVAYYLAISAYALWGMGAVIAAAVWALVLGTVVNLALRSEDEAATRPPRRDDNDYNPWNPWRW